MPVVQQSDTTSYIQRNVSSDTLILRDSVYRHDSIIYRERMVHDTVYITKEVYRDANTHNSSLIVRNSIDTVVVTEWREKVVEHPPERSVPKFYKRCTIALWAIIALLIGRLALKRWLCWI